MTHTDSKLLESLKNSEQSALKSIFEAHYPMVFRSIYRLIPDTALAEDLSQEVFLKLWEKRLKINIKSSIAAYIRKMSVNEALGQLRKNKKMQCPVQKHQTAMFCQSNSFANAKIEISDGKTRKTKKSEKWKKKCNLWMKMK